jgi:hypothetical protein
VTLAPADKTRILFHTIGSPIGTGTLVPKPDDIEQLTEYAFKSRVGLLFLDECLRREVELGPAARELHASLTKRREATDAVVVRLARKLDEIARGEWVLFKSIKPFAATPNDTDWFPLNPKRHAELVQYLQQDGDFKLLEVAPRQTTLIESSGEGVTDTTKKGGVYYVDCYVYPSTDYFIYLDPRRLRDHVRTTQINGYRIPILSPPAELAAIMFHNVFPERTFTPESYYLVKSYLDRIESEGCFEDLVRVCRQQRVEYAAAANLAFVRAVDREQFGLVDDRVQRVMRDLGHESLELPGFDPCGAYPHQLSNRVFWGAFLSKQRDGTSLRSSFTQLLHMLNPVFFADVVKIIWRRSVQGGVYEQN